MILIHLLLPLFQATCCSLVLIKTDFSPIYVRLSFLSVPFSSHLHRLFLLTGVNGKLFMLGSYQFALVLDLGLLCQLGQQQYLIHSSLFLAMNCSNHCPETNQLHIHVILLEVLRQYSRLVFVSCSFVSCLTWHNCGAWIARYGPPVLGRIVHKKGPWYMG